MDHATALRVAALTMAGASLCISTTAWLFARRMRTLFRKMSHLNKLTLLDGWRGGLEDAARVVGLLAEKTYSNEPELSALLSAEGAIHQLIHAVKEARDKI